MWRRKNRCGHARQSERIVASMTWGKMNGDALPAHDLIEMVASQLVLAWVRSMGQG
jgi:hypothetical protein